MRTANYVVVLPKAGEYLVTATKDGVGIDQTKVAVQRGAASSLANLTLWKAAGGKRAAKNCGTSRSIGALQTR